VSTAPRPGLPVPSASRALDKLRDFVILLVLAFHSVLAYLNFLPASAFPFDIPPYLGRAFPIFDTQRWFGFDLFSAWQDVFLMSLFFFLSGLFVWPASSAREREYFSVIAGTITECRSEWLERPRWVVCHERTV
jgi:hypothetical protein